MTNHNLMKHDPKFMIRQSIKPIVTIASLCILFSGCANVNLQRASRYKNEMQYAFAAQSYKKAMKRDSSIAIQSALAECYVKMKKSEDAELIYKDLANKNKLSEDDKKNYALVLMNNKKYGEAENILSTYIQYHEKDQAAGEYLNSCRNINTLTDDSVLYSINYLPVNSNKGSSFSPAYNQDGIIYASDAIPKLINKKFGWTGNGYIDLYFTAKSGFGEWSDPLPLNGEVNREYHEGPITLSKSGREMYFTRNTFLRKNKERKNFPVNNLKIFSVQMPDKVWKNCTPFPYNDDNYSSGHPALSPDEKRLYFISDMPGGFGGTDIYYCDKQNGQWTKPVNLGPPANTSGNEMFPYIAADGALYFSSDGHGGLGGLDIFEVKKIKNEIVVTNMEYPINSSSDDFGFIIDTANKSGYFSSNRNDRNGYDHLYSFTRNSFRYKLEGVVVNKNTHEPLPGSQIISKQHENDSTRIITADDKGKFSLGLMPQSQYTISASLSQFNLDTVIENTHGKNPAKVISVTMELEPAVRDNTASQSSIADLDINNIYYDFDKWNIRKDAAETLDLIIGVLSRNPALKISLSSHCDSRGTSVYNNWLSSKRSTAAYDYIISKGIQPERITEKMYYGKTRPVNRCLDAIPCSEKEHQLNRRTEFALSTENTVEKKGITAGK